MVPGLRLTLAPGQKYYKGEENMFNTYMLGRSLGPTSMNASISVKEERASTDESIRLLNEMQEKARCNLIEHFIVDDNELKGKIFVFRDWATYEYIVVVAFTLNGKKYESEHSFKQFSSKIENLRELLVQAVKEAIFKTAISTWDCESNILDHRDFL
jgi:hypothetical protein